MLLKGLPGFKVLLQMVIDLASSTKLQDEMHMRAARGTRLAAFVRSMYSLHRALQEDQRATSKQLRVAKGKNIDSIK